MPATDFELQEPWFRLIAVTAFSFLPVILAPVSKIARTFDKKASICKSPIRFISGIFPVTFYCLAHLGLYTTGLFIHLNESTPAEDEYFYEINVLVYTVGLILALAPHIYTINWYDYRKHMNYKYSKSWGLMSSISGVLMPMVVFAAWGLLLSAIVLTAIDGRWTAFGVYLGYEVLITLAFLYFLLELVWCANTYRKYTVKSGKSGLAVLILMERDARTSGSTKMDIDLSQGIEMMDQDQPEERLDQDQPEERPYWYGRRRRGGYNMYGR